MDDIVPPRTRDLERERRGSGSSYAPTVIVDDINVPPPGHHGQDEMIQVIPRISERTGHPPAPLQLRNSHLAVDPRVRLSQSIDAALDAVTIPHSPTSQPLPPSPLSPSSFDTQMTERGRERRGRLFSGAGVSSMWVHADSRTGREREQGRGNVKVGGVGGGNGQRQSMKPYEKLKTLTKRYSLSFPLSVFVDRARPGVSVSASASAGAGGGRRPTSYVSSPD